MTHLVNHPDALDADALDGLVRGSGGRLDLVWLRDASLEDGGSLPPPEVLVREIVDDLEAALAESTAVVEGRRGQPSAALHGTHERDAVDVARLPATSHVALAHPDAHGGVMMLRRGYSFVDGTDGLGHLDAGLFFLAYQRDPRTAFVPIQKALARSDARGDYLRHTGSSVWAVPPGVQPGGWWGQSCWRRRTLVA